MCMSSSMTSTQQIVQRRQLLLPEALLVFHCDKRSHLCISGLLISRLQLSGCHQAAWRSGGEGRVPLCPSWVGSSSRNLWHCSSAAASAPEEPPGSSSNSWRILLESCIFWSPALRLCFILLQSASPQHFQAPHASLHVKDLHISLVLGISCHLLKTPLLWDWVPLDLCPEQPQWSLSSTKRGNRISTLFFFFNSQGKAFRKSLSISVVKSDVQPKNSLSVRAESIYSELTGGTEVGRSTLVNISKTNFPHQVSSSFSLCCLNRNVKRNC